MFSFFKYLFFFISLIFFFLKKNLENYDEAQYYYEKAIEVDPDDKDTLFKYACFWESIQQYDNAEKYYLSSLEKNANESNYLTVYADFLARFFFSYYKIL